MTDRTQLQPVEGLTRATQIVSPPKRSPRPTQPRPPAATTPPSQPAAPQPRPTKRAASEAMKRVTLSLPVVVVEALRERAARDRASQSDVLMDALEASSDRLGELLSKEQETQRRSGLFVRSVARASEPLTTLSLRLLAGNVKVIDELAESLEASSRSRMCTAALRDYLHTN